ncbi:hypothetical protein FQA39_LY13347 [Lamprigera yunnana]|nr:hypothetical protein FQA39_LY13347 [Lamprigera yunnana]
MRTLKLQFCFANNNVTCEVCGEVAVVNPYYQSFRIHVPDDDSALEQQADEEIAMDSEGGAELKYEVALRGFFEEVSVMELRKSLRSILKLERDSSFGTVEHDFLLDADIEAITAGAESLGSAIEEFNGDVSTSTFQRISILFFHLFRRERMTVANNEENAQQRLWLLTLANLRSECDAKFKLFRRYFPIASPIRALTVSSPAPPTKDVDDFLSSSDSETNITPTTVAAHGFSSRYIPANKWGLKEMEPCRLMRSWSE